MQYMMAVRDDKVSFTLSFADGSFGTVHYLANGHRGFPKEWEEEETVQAKRKYSEAPCDYDE